MTATTLTAAFEVGEYASIDYLDSDAINRRRLYKVTGRTAQFVTLKEVWPWWRPETDSRTIRKRLDRVGDREAVWVAPAFVYPAKAGNV
jgi:hypothetical protein